MATPVEHYEEAERLLDEAARATDPLTAARMVTRASVEATLASVPWARDDADEVAAGLNREQVAALVDALGNLNSWARHHNATLAPGVADEDQEAYLAGWNAARRIVGDLLAEAAREVLPE